MITEARRLVFLSLNFLNLCFCVFLLLSYLFFYFFWCIRFRFKDWGLSTLKTPNQRENQLPHGGTSAFMFRFCQPVLTLCSLCLQSSMPTSCLYWVHPLMTRCGHLYAIQPLPNLDANMTFNTWNSNWVIFWTLIGRLWNVQEI